jgi:Domain of unknown function (DUF4190)
MSDTSQGPGWWLASDGKWYSPELWTGPPSTRPAGAPIEDQPEQPTSPAQPEYGTQPTYPPQGPVAVPGTTGSVPPTPPPYGAVPYGATPYGATPTGAPPSYGATPYSSTPYYAPGTPYAPYGHAAPSKTNGLAIAALVCGIAGFILFIPAVLGVIFGFVARAQIKKSGGTQKGGGMALAGIIVGFAWLAVLVLIIAFPNHNNNANDVINPAGFPLQLLLGGHAN